MWAFSENKPGIFPEQGKILHMTGGILVNRTIASQAVSEL